METTIILLLVFCEYIGILIMLIILAARTTPSRHPSLPQKSGDGDGDAIHIKKPVFIKRQLKAAKEIKEKTRKHIPYAGAEAYYALISKKQNYKKTAQAIQRQTRSSRSTIQNYLRNYRAYWSFHSSSVPAISTTKMQNIVGKITEAYDSVIVTSRGKEDILAKHFDVHNTTYRLQLERGLSYIMGMYPKMYDQIVGMSELAAQYEEKHGVFIRSNRPDQRDRV